MCIHIIVLDMATGPDQEITPEERRERGRIIATALQYYYVQLIKTIDVQEAAHCLFGVRIITDNERDMAVTTGYESSQTRAGKLIAILINKVEANPHMFKAACQALEQAGAESITDEIKGIHIFENRMLFSKLHDTF